MMYRYRVHFKSTIIGREGTFTFDTSDMNALDGFWLNQDFEYEVGEGATFYFPPHTITHIEKIKHG